MLSAFCELQQSVAVFVIAAETLWAIGQNAQLM